jgi:HAD superfamily hydrolase (TIGR01509 family)
MTAADYGITNSPHPMKTFQAVLFDCDGVLLDSENFGCGSLAQAISEVGHSMTVHEATGTFSGNSSSDTRAWMVLHGLDADKVFTRADEILFELFETSVPLMPGIAELLHALPLKKAVCSNSSIRRLERSIERTEIAPYFDRHIYSAEHVPNAKPAPDLALYACNALQVLPSEAIFIDDNIHGIRCAKAAGCLAVGFIGPSDMRGGQRAALIASGADYVVNGMDECLTLFKHLTSNIREDID